MSANDKAVHIGKAAHITAAAPGGPRYDESLTDRQRRSAENGVYLCPDCADLVDKNRGVDYTPDQLRQWKRHRDDAAGRGVRGEAASPPQAVARPGLFEPAWFYVYPGYTTRTWENFTPQWTLRQLRGDDAGFVEYRYRSRYHEQDWRQIPSHRLDGIYLTAEIDFSGGPQHGDEKVGQDELGVEIRCPTENGWRHELHRFRIQRTEHQSPLRYHMENDGDAIQPPSVWYEPFDDQRWLI